MSHFRGSIERLKQLNMLLSHSIRFFSLVLEKETFLLIAYNSMCRPLFSVVVNMYFDGVFLILLKLYYPEKIFPQLK